MYALAHVRQKLKSRCLHCHSRRREAAELAERRKIEETAQLLAVTEAEIALLRSELMAVKAEAAREKRMPSQVPPDDTNGELDAASITCVHRATWHSHMLSVRARVCACVVVRYMVPPPIVSFHLPFGVSPGEQLSHRGKVQCQPHTQTRLPPAVTTLTPAAPLKTQSTQAQAQAHPHPQPHPGRLQRRPRPVADRPPSPFMAQLGNYYNLLAAQSARDARTVPTL